MEFHEVADIFPMMSSEEYESLKADIKQNGLLQPIWTYEDQIIDGRNRYNACLDLGIIPQYQTWDGTGSLVAFVVSLNLQRRHLNSSQKAFVALEVERLLAVEARQRKSEAISISNQENPRKQTKPTLDIFQDPTESELSINQNFDSMKNDTRLYRQKNEQDQPQASEQAAKLTGTNRQYVQDAKFIQEKAPDVAEAVKSGTIKIYEAKKVAALPEEQRKVVIEKVQSGEKPSQAIHEAKQEDKVSKTIWTESELKRKELVEKGHTVTAHQNNDVQLIAWAEANGKFVRIDRFSDWGNPFLFPGDGDRNTVIAHYKQYLLWRPTLIKRLDELKGKVLGCWCHPEECHGDAIIEVMLDDNPF